ncbi:hypothetical protein [uncultured Clostridium sp.]|uniref:hypothetical protein n=1 Tax=uncultured Clostridium sp. TaxID=59620 RepID=UPI0032177C74
MKLFNAICYDDDYDIQEVQNIIATNEGEAIKKVQSINQFYSDIKVRELSIVGGYKVKLERIEE